MDTVKKNLIFSVGMLVVGIVLMVIFATGIVPEKISASMIMGMGSGLTSAGLVSTFICLRTMKNPQKKEEVEISLNDERNILLREKTNSKVYSIFVYVECFLIFISGVLGYREISILLALLVLSKLIVWFVVCTNLSKKY